MYELEIYRGVMFDENLEWYKIWTGIDLLFQNWQDKFNKDFNWLFLTKVYNVLAKMVQRSHMFDTTVWYHMFDTTEDWCKIWRNTDLCFQKWHGEFGKFSQAEK